MGEGKCPRHGRRCAYTGDEPGRCAHCHRSWARIARDEDPVHHGRVSGIAEQPHAIAAGEATDRFTFAGLDTSQARALAIELAGEGMGG